MEGRPDRVFDRAPCRVARTGWALAGTTRLGCCPGAGTGVPSVAFPTGLRVLRSALAVASLPHCGHRVATIAPLANRRRSRGHETPRSSAATVARRVVEGVVTDHRAPRFGRPSRSAPGAKVKGLSTALLPGHPSASRCAVPGWTRLIRPSAAQLSTRGPHPAVNRSRPLLPSRAPSGGRGSTRPLVTAPVDSTTASARPGILPRCSRFRHRRSRVGSARHHRRTGHPRRSPTESPPFSPAVTTPTPAASVPPRNPRLERLVLEQRPACTVRRPFPFRVQRAGFGDDGFRSGRRVRPPTAGRLPSPPAERYPPLSCAPWHALPRESHAPPRRLADRQEQRPTQASGRPRQSTNHAPGRTSRLVSCRAKPLQPRIRRRPCPL